MNSFSTLRGACAVLLAGAAFSLLLAQNPPLRLTRTIPLPGVEGRIDHFAYDPASERLFVCALGNNTAEVIDLAKGERVRSITSLGSPQGVAYIPEFDRIIIANDNGGICRIYDGKTLQPLAQIDLKDDADNIRYDAKGKKLYVGFGSGGIAVINPSNGSRIGSIKLSAHPEAFELEKNGNRIFVNVPNARHVAVADRDQGKVIATWKTDLTFANFPMALDETDHRLFVGCRMPSKLVVLNTQSGEVMSKIDISGDCDDVFYDSKRLRIYAICGAGKIDVIEQVDANNYKTATRLETAFGARTGLLVSQLDALFVAVPHRGSQQAEIREYHLE